MGYSKTSLHLYNSVTREYEKTYQSQSEIEREFGLYRGAVSDIIRGHCNSRKLLLSPVKYDKFPESDKELQQLPKLDELKSYPNQIPQITAQNTLSESELRKKHDMYFIIYSFVSTIPEGRYIDEASMLRQLGLIGKPRYREALGRPELKDFRGKVDGVVYYGCANSIKKLKMEGVLQ